MFVLFYTEPVVSSFRWTYLYTYFHSFIFLKSKIYTNQLVINDDMTSRFIFQLDAMFLLEGIQNVTVIFVLVGPPFLFPSSLNFLGKVIRLEKKLHTDFYLTQIGLKHPSRVIFSQCRGKTVTENGLRNLFRTCVDSLQVGTAL